MVQTPTLEIVLYCSTPSSSSLQAIKTWVDPYSKSTIIYASSPVPISEMVNFKRVVILPNIITESQSYLHHIASKGKLLATVTIFCHSGSSNFLTTPVPRMVELARLTQVGEVTTFSGIDLVLFDAWELSSPSTKNTTKNGNGSIPIHQHRQASPDDGLIQLSGKALDLFKTKEHNITTPASVLWNAMAPSGKFRKLPLSIGYQPGCTFAVHRDTILQHAGDYWDHLYSQYFSEASSVASLEAGYYLSKFWWAFLSDEYILYDDDVVEKNKWVQKSGGRRELTKGNWARRLQPDAIVAKNKGRNLHHFRTRSCSIDSENRLIRDMALYGIPSLSPLIEKTQAQSLGIVPTQIGLRKARSMGLPTVDMSTLEVDTPAKIHRSISDNSAY